jgi:hypothetical protein
MNHWRQFGKLRAPADILASYNVSSDIYLRVSRRLPKLPLQDERLSSKQFRAILNIAISAALT